LVSSFSPVPPPGEECVGGGRSPYNDDMLSGLRFSINLVYFIKGNKLEKGCNYQKR